MNDLGLVRSVLRDLRASRLDALLFGGWAEEVRGISRPRVHGDIDLLLVDPSGADLAAFLRGRQEIRAKRLSHKRAYLTGGVLVEMIVVGRANGVYVTKFWDELSWIWPDRLGEVVDGLQVASPEALVAYRRDWNLIHRRRAT